PTLSGAQTVTLHGPGILESITIQTPLELAFWQQWQVMTQAYPLGVDIWCCAKDQILGLPRTARLVEFPQVPEVPS
ncbi:MAG: phosphonate C-P lyase system protein PhnH, partial [Prochlorothrix sp.]